MQAQPLKCITKFYKNKKMIEETGENPKEYNVHYIKLLKIDYENC